MYLVVFEKSLEHRKNKNLWRDLATVKHFKRQGISFGCEAFGDLQTITSNSDDPNKQRTTRSGA